MTEPHSEINSLKSTDKTMEEWPLKDVNKPFGISNYKLKEEVRELEQEKETRENRLRWRVVFCKWMNVLILEKMYFCSLKTHLKSENL